MQQRNRDRHSSESFRPSFCFKRQQNVSEFFSDEFDVIVTSGPSSAARAAGPICLRTERVRAFNIFLKDPSFEIRLFEIVWS